MTERRARIWVGIDAGKGHHWAAAVDESGFQVWSKKIDNDEAAILEAVAEALAMAGAVDWAIDLSGTASALLLALLASHGQKPVYVPGRTVNRMSGAYRGEAKTDARDAFVIAETSRLRRDFAAVDVPAQLVADLALLVAHRTDLVADRVRMVNRLRDVLTGIFPALERAFDWSGSKGALTLLTYRQTPAGIRRVGRARLESWLRKRGVRSADKVAATALEAAGAQHTVVAAGDLSAYADAGRLASAAGLVPVPRDSGRRTGNLHRPKRYSRRLRRVFYMSAQTSMIKDGPNRGFYLKKRAEGCGHVQALIALARRRVNVLWALLRDGREFTPAQPVAQAA
ncbi:IS110 family transposase [Streptomyces kaniharaensis]|uniref:IS110 family transposase n=1 Tax=Streptomyces kaniharaensis TaxID=212423 RepID=A0A6N7L3H9_9ACTN|nr:transposase [Streptomyces kaniharaensis]MQS16393.1 IS110 family transposase [Streptomyces kaniharaensis]